MPITTCTLPALVSLAITVRLRPPWSVPRCSMEARCRVGTLMRFASCKVPAALPLLGIVASFLPLSLLHAARWRPVVSGRACYLPPSPHLPSRGAAWARWCLLPRASGQRHASSQPLLPVPHGTVAARCCGGRAGTDASCVGPAALHPARHHGDIAGAVADAALLGGGLLLCGCASAYCLVHGAGRPHCAIVLCCCRRCRCRTARLRPAVAWRARADHSVHATCHPHPTCHHG